jgi:uncharacterized protein YcbK (DUF882 family)
MKDSANRFSRRQALRGLTVAAGGIVLLASWQNALASEVNRSVSLYHTHTDEKLKLTYFEDGQYHHEAIGELNKFLRDHRTGEIFPINLQLIDMLFVLERATESRGAIEIISAYRSPVTNEALRAEDSGVAKQSLHIEGRALDIRFTDVNVFDLRNAALNMKAGGVGFYPKSNFIHIDNGRVRSW